MQKILFIHIPKTAGSSLNASAIGRKVDAKIHPFKTTISEKITEIGAESYFKFCFVRNPWDRFASLYSYFSNMSEDHPYYKFNVPVCNIVQRHLNFEDFCIKFPESRLQNNFHFYPQCKYIYDEGRKIPDFVGKVESINEDIVVLANILGISNINSLPHKNKSKSPGYQHLYTNETRDIIGKIYEDDVTKLSYLF